MPIRPENKARYPKDWRQISVRIRERAGNRCEGTPDRPHCRAENRKPHPETGSMVILTVAHMDRALVDHSDGNLRALCQKCHLAWDMAQHKETARRTRNRKRGQSDLFEEREAH